MGNDARVEIGEVHKFISMYFRAPSSKGPTRPQPINLWTSPPHLTLGNFCTNVAPSIGPEFVEGEIRRRGKVQERTESICVP